MFHVFTRCLSLGLHVLSSAGPEKAANLLVFVNITCFEQKPKSLGGIVPNFKVPWMVLFQICSKILIPCRILVAMATKRKKIK